ncbi:MAG: Stk1 family PASTA domain-containing Ser/Thr kinase [Mycobacteriales bacterium]
MSQTLTDALTGTVLDGRYHLDARIARGGMATVYRATDSKLERTVAIKVLHPDLAENEEFVARFAREARATAGISSPHVVAVYDHGISEHKPYLVMEYVPGATLRELLNERGRLSPAEALSVLVPVLEGLAAAHAAGVVHRDVKPENVLIGQGDAAGAVKVVDFGVARAVRADAPAEEMILGTVSYLAPEQVTTGKADFRTDVYAAGVVLFEMLTGTPPFHGKRPHQVAQRHVNEDVPAPSDLVGDLPPEVDALVVRATRREPGARPADAGALLAELRDVQDDLGLPTAAIPALATTAAASTGLARRRHTTELPKLRVNAGAERDRGPGRLAAPARSRRRGLWVFAVIAVLAVVAAVGGWYLGMAHFTHVPALAGMSQQDARKQAGKAHLKLSFDDPVYSETVPTGHVADQSPDAGKRVSRGGTVTVRLSRGKERYTLPDLTGRKRTDAENALRKLHLTAKVEQDYSDSVPRNQVLSTSPDAGAVLRRGQQVTLTVSKGPAPVEVPDVTGQDINDAAAALADKGLTVSRTDRYDDTAPVGAVLSQNPPAGAKAHRGDKITLTVSKGQQPIDVPDVTGRTYEQAKGILTTLGFKVKRVAIAGGPGDRVTSQDPAPDGKLARGGTVTLYVL